MLMLLPVASCTVSTDTTQLSTKQYAGRTLHRAHAYLIDLSLPNKNVQVVRWALLFNHGQCCAAGTRLYVHESIYDEFMNTYLQKIKEW